MSRTGSSPTTWCRSRRRRLLPTSNAHSRTPTSCSSQPMKIARARRSRGTCSTSSNPKFRSSGWFFTRSPKRPFSARRRTLAISTPRWSTRKKPDEFSTGSMATKCRRCCGARSVRVCRLAGCSPQPPVWSSIASVSASLSSPPATGISSPRSPRPSRPPPSTRASRGLTGRASLRVATSTIKARSRTTHSYSMRPQRRLSPRHFAARMSPCGSHPSNPSRTPAARQLPSPLRHFSRKQPANCGSPPVRR